MSNPKAPLELIVASVAVQKSAAFLPPARVGIGLLATRRRRARVAWGGMGAAWHGPGAAWDCANDGSAGVQTPHYGHIPPPSFAVIVSGPVAMSGLATMSLRASVLGASVLGASVLGASVLGASVLGASVLGASVLGASVLGASVLGASVLGASVLGASVLGASVLGASVLGVSVLGVSVLGVSVLGVSVLGGLGPVRLAPALPGHRGVWWLDLAPSRGWET